MKKILTIAAIAALTATSTMNTTAYAADVPAISVSIVGDTVVNDESAEYTIIYEGDVSLIVLSEKSIGLEGFTANKALTINDDNTATLTLTNIVDTVGENTIHITGGTAITSDNIMAGEATLENIVIKNNANPNTGLGLSIVSTVVSALSALALRKRNK